MDINSNCHGSFRESCHRWTLHLFQKQNSQSPKDTSCVWSPKLFKNLYFFWISIFSSDASTIPDGFQPQLHLCVVRTVDLLVKDSWQVSKCIAWAYGAVIAHLCTSVNRDCSGTELSGLKQAIFSIFCDVVTGSKHPTPYMLIYLLSRFVQISGRGQEKNTAG